MTDSQSRPDGLTGVLDAISEAVSSARAMPMSSSVLVSKTELLDLVDQARQALPSQFAQAAALVAEVDQARAAAHAEAEKIVQEAKTRSSELISEHEVVVQAVQEADRIVREAQAQARQLRLEADDYCDRRLADFEIDVGKVLAQVQAGRAKLAERLER